MARKRPSFITYVLLLTFYITGCVSDKPKQEDDTMPSTSTGLVYVVCEGSLGNGNAELTIYDRLADSTFNSCFKKNNQNSLGDIFQSMYVGKDELWLSVNNSDQIVIIDKQTFLQKSKINITRPRYLVDAGKDRLIVGSIFGKQLSLINTKAQQIERTLQMPKENAEGILVIGEVAYVCCWDTSCTMVYAVDIPSFTIKDSIPLSGNAPQYIVSDKNSNIWVSGGNIYKSQPSYIDRIDLSTKSIQHSYTFHAETEVLKSCFNKAKDSLYYILVNQQTPNQQNGVYKMPIDARSIPSAPLVSTTSFQYFWALGVDPLSGNVYIGDPKGFIQKGQVLIYSPQGSLLKTFQTDLGVSSFYFN